MPPDSEVPARHVRRRFTTAYKPQVKKLAQENRRLQKAEALLAFQKKFPSCCRSP